VGVNIEDQMLDYAYIVGNQVRAMMWITCWCIDVWCKCIAVLMC
jgi:hypothetical protein